MAGYGPPPNKKKRRRNADLFQGQHVAVSADGPTDAPDLPNASAFSEWTRSWYETWTRAPQASAFVATDWQRLHMLASLVESYYAEPSAKLLSEIRLNESLLGATHVDRLRGRIVVSREDEAADSGMEMGDSAASVTRLAERRNRLNGA
ncbi:hypothetical protein NLX83_21490 [Allokutzneria sp. A3M-2-11 16]|uniref:phage terminase small subunit n=1 Tax=Allokutzneria sp. A3M-2-11 16 TaxID=2962043 RepID=UPI0020B7F63B|nr:hypothetical protein [Allokutzneria sp. A3M-2-11 16]MCP3801843.1 hypothetical protein [Allokutzneria sp. A3M-2-11 16]